MQKGSPSNLLSDVYAMHNITKLCGSALNFPPRHPNTQAACWLKTWTAFIAWNPLVMLISQKAAKGTSYMEDNCDSTCWWSAKSSFWYIDESERSQSLYVCINERSHGHTAHFTIPCLPGHHICIWVSILWSPSFPLPSGIGSRTRRMSHRKVQAHSWLAG